MAKPVRSIVVRCVWRTTVVAGLLGCAMLARAGAQGTQLPFDVGERLRYRVTLGRLGTVGEGGDVGRRARSRPRNRNARARGRRSPRESGSSRPPSAPSRGSTRPEWRRSVTRSAHSAHSRATTSSTSSSFPRSAMGRPARPLRGRAHERSARRAVLHLLPPHPAARRGHRGHAWLGTTTRAESDHRARPGPRYRAHERRERSPRSSSRCE